MKMNLKFAAMLFMAGAWAHAQVVPDAIGPSGVPLVGYFDYSLRYSQIAYIYSASMNLSNQVTSMASGSVDYAHASERRPFTLNYIGGYMWDVSGPSLGTGVFQHAALSQSFVQERWKVILKDDFSDTPQAPTVGASGVAGTGEPISGTSTGGSSTIVTINTRTLSNTATGEFDFNLDRKTVLTLFGGTEVLDYPYGGGLNTNGELANVGITRNLNTRTSFWGQFQYSYFSFGASPYTDNLAGNFNVDAGLVGAQHAWSRQLRTSVEIGPQWTSNSDTSYAPAFTTVTVNANALDQWHNGSADLNYYRGIVSATGFFPAAVVDSVKGNFSWRFGRSTNAGITGTYLRYSALPTVGGDSSARYGEALLSRRFGRYFDFIAEYTAIDQGANISSSAPQSNILNELYQVVTFGVAFTPRETRINQ